jgi:hypothetical protein
MFISLFLVILGFLSRSIHHRGTEFAEFGAFLNQNLFTPRPPRLGGAISELCFTAKPEDPFFFDLSSAAMGQESSLFVQ